MTEEGDRWRLRRDVFLLTVAIWLFFSAWLLAGQWLIDDFGNVKGAIISRLGACLPGILMCLVIYFLLERGMSRPFWQLIALVLLLGIPGGLACLDIERRALAVLLAALEGRSLLSPPPDVPSFIYMQRALFWTFFFLSWASAVLALVYSSRAAAEQRMRVEAQSLAHQAMLASLRYQLNPHFLFNSLNSIAALVEERQADEAGRMINRLSDFLRAGLDTDPLEEVPLSAELAQQRRYLEIERIRFPNRLAFVLDVDGDVESTLVPSLILQPLVENAIKYGVAPSSELVTVTIEAKRAGQNVRIVVRDDGSAQKSGASGSGIGLHNVRERLASSFGQSASIESSPLAAGGYAVTLTLPLKRP